MTTGELLVALFEAYRDNDDSAFLRVGMTLIEEEKAKNHYVLANKLKKILSSSPEVNGLRPFTNKLSKVVELPKDKDNGTELVKVIYPHTEPPAHHVRKEHLVPLPYLPLTSY